MKQTMNFEGAGWQALTARERELLYPVTEGKANKLIAMEMGISMRTVEAHRSRIFKKMGVRNAVQLARAVYANPELAQQMQSGALVEQPGSPQN